jgi:hypothetical protein
MRISHRQSAMSRHIMTKGFLALTIFFPDVAKGQWNSTQFLNPILPGFHPDPSCAFIVEEETFYCASSSFNAFPGIPIHASKDLKTWRLVGEFIPQFTLAYASLASTRSKLPTRGPIRNLNLHTVIPSSVSKMNVTMCSLFHLLVFLPKSFRPPVFRSLDSDRSSGVYYKCIPAPVLSLPECCFIDYCRNPCCLLG